MQSTIHVTPTDHDVDAHAPASTYYTTGNNSSGALNRLKTYTVIYVSLYVRYLSTLLTVYTQRRTGNDPFAAHSIPRRRRASHGKYQPRFMAHAFYTCKTVYGTSLTQFICLASFSLTTPQHANQRLYCRR
jgi:hypothetical protein